MNIVDDAWVGRRHLRGLRVLPSQRLAHIHIGNLHAEVVHEEPLDTLEDGFVFPLLCGRHLYLPNDILATLVLATDLHQEVPTAWAPEAQSHQPDATLQAAVSSLQATFACLDFPRKLD